MLYWAKLADRVGRKPALLACVIGSATLMLIFGLSSRWFWALVVIRSVCGVFNGVGGLGASCEAVLAVTEMYIVRTMLAELSDSTNEARIFSSQASPWCTIIQRLTSHRSLLGPSAMRWRAYAVSLRWS